MGLSYGGFVGYTIAAQWPEKVEKVVIACSGVCFEESDMDKGLLSVKSIDDATSILLAQTPEKLKELMRMAFFKPPQNVPSCFLSDFIDVRLLLVLLLSFSKLSWVLHHVLNIESHN